MKNVKLFLLLVIYTISFSVQGKTEIAFLKVYKMDGSLLQLEVGAIFSHLAIKVQKGWLHSHPNRGVEIVKKLKDIGFKKIKIVSLVSEEIVLKEKMYIKYIGRSFDSKFSWDDKKLYCSELVAKIFKFKPTPMTFHPEIWGENHPAKGELGISPDEVYQAALEAGFK